MPEPFRYPDQPHIRRHGPVYTAYESYRPWLRDEFSFRCVYCLKREQWGIVRGTLDIDHFVPQQIAPGRVTDYDDLVFHIRTGDDDLIAFDTGLRKLPLPVFACNVEALQFPALRLQTAVHTRERQDDFRIIKVKPRG